MAVYVWEAKTRQGSTKKGDMEAVNEAAVQAQLRAQGLMPTKVKSKPKNVEDIFPFLQSTKVKTKELVIFTRQFATMIDAGLPLVQCLTILGNNADNPALKRVILEVKSDVEQGATFAESLAKHPKVFDNLYVNLVAAGEVGGILDTILNRLASYLEKADKLASQVKGAMVYPVTVITVSIAVIVLLLVKVIPVFEKMFADFGGELPGPTQMVVNLSHWLQAYVGYMLIAAVSAVVGFGQARKRSLSFRYQTDALMLKLPVFGDLLRKVAVARFSRTLSTMIASGVPILDALEIVAKTAGNMVIEEELMRTRAAISEGKTMVEPLEESAVFPPMVVQMIGVGEEAGAMETMLSKIADFYDDEVDAAVGALTAMLEPMMMVFLGGSIGTILIAMYLPIFKIAEAVG
ncbi:MAG: type II secretion system F family protein [Proteobacteria bacterium]|nr:type II secretion system F family protein [Pseudomonadota bacterium]